MKKPVRQAVVLLMALPAALAFFVTIWFFGRHPYAASAAGAALFFGGMAFFIKRRLTLWLAPCRTAEKRVEQYVRTGKPVHFFTMPLRRTWTGNCTALMCVLPGLSCSMTACARLCLLPSGKSGRLAHSQLRRGADRRLRRGDQGTLAYWNAGRTL